MDTKKGKFRSFSSIVKFISGVLSWTILVILVIVACFLVYYFVSVKVYAQKGEDYKPAFALYTILSPSMEPNIKVYDVIFDVNVNSPEDIKEGDVITFVSTATLTKGMTITHRVVEIFHDENGYSYMTKGDNNIPNDGTAVPYDHVLGKVLFKIPQLGRIQEFLGTKGGWLIVVVIPAILVILSDILKLFRLQDAKKEVDNYENKEALKLEDINNKKKEIAENLNARYANVKKDLEIKKETEEPVITDINEELPKLNTNNTIEDKDIDLPLELPKMVDIPKLKDNSKPVSLELPKLTKEEHSLDNIETQVKPAKKNSNRKRTPKKNSK
mgnify:CR=1 FL=1